MRELLRRDVTSLEPLAVVLVAYVLGVFNAAGSLVGGWFGTAALVVTVMGTAWCGARAAGWNVGSPTSRRRVHSSEESQ